MGNPRVAYRETIQEAAEITHLHKKQSGGPGEWAKVTLRIEPAPRGAGLVFEDQTRGGAIPQEYIPAVFAGCRNAASCGVLGGHPVVDVQVVLVDGATHSNDSSEHAFEKAGRDAFRSALHRASPVVLEPLMDLRVTIPASNVGDVIGDIASRRGRVRDMQAEGPLQTIRAEVPLAELFGYAGQLASLSQGRGSHHLELSRYDSV